MRAKWAVVGGIVAALAVAATVTYVRTRGGTTRLTVGLSEPATLLPGLVDDPAGRLVVGALWTPLTEVDPSGRAVPRLAASVTSVDQRVWTIALRPGWRFHDGTPVTARAVAGTWQANLVQGWRGAALLSDTLRVHGGRPGATDISGLRVTDEHTIEVTLDAPFAELPLVLSAPALQPLPESVLATRDWAGFAAHPVGTGPYRLAEAWRRGHGATLHRFDGYGGPAATPVARVDLRVLDPATQYAEVDAGNLDLATDLPPDRHGTLADTFGARSRTWPQGQSTYLAFAPTDRRFADPGVRRAFSLAIDRASLAAGPLGHQVSPLTALIPPGVPGARTGACRGCLHDQAAARATLAEVGGPPAGPVHLWHRPSHSGWVTALADQLSRALNITVLPRLLTSPAPADGIVVIDHALPYPSPYPVLAMAGAHQPELGRLSATAARHPDPDERLRDYRLAENIALRDLPLIPLWSAHGHAAWSPRIAAPPDADLSGPRLDVIR